eukprot:1389633-Amorphochlora_amoeboformis.AAC.1
MTNAKDPSVLRGRSGNLGMQCGVREGAGVDRSGWVRPGQKSRCGSSRIGRVKERSRVGEELKDICGFRPDVGV